MTWLNIGVHGKFLKRMPVQSAEVVQIAPGSLDFQTIEIWGRNMFLIKIRSRAHGVFTAVPYDGFVGLIVPLNWQGAFRVNGCKANPADIFYVDCTHAVTVTCTDAQRILFGVRRDLINRLLIQENGVADPDFLSGSRVIDDSGECAERLDATVGRLLTDSPDTEGHPEGLNIGRDDEEDLARQMAAWLASKLKKPTRYWLGQESAYLVTDKIREALRQSPSGARLQLADLYDIAGVSKNRLHQSFMQVYGVSPWQYVLKQRLHAARQFLLESENAQVSIADAAATYGFSTSGRFAQKYRELFGEFPSETQKSAKRFAARS